MEIRHSGLDVRLRRAQTAEHRRWTHEALRHPAGRARPPRRRRRRHAGLLRVRHDRARHVAGRSPAPPPVPRRGASGRGRAVGALPAACASAGSRVRDPRDADRLGPRARRDGVRSVPPRRAARRRPRPARAHPTATPTHDGGQHEDGTNDGGEHEGGTTTAVSTTTESAWPRPAGGASGSTRGSATSTRAPPDATGAGDQVPAAVLGGTSRDVEPEPGVPRPGRGRRRPAASRVRDHRAGRCPRPARRLTRKPTPSGVWAKTLSMSTSSRSARSASLTGHEQRARGDRRRVSGAAVVLGQGRPEGDPCRRSAAAASHRARERVLHRSPGLLDDLVDGQLERRDVVLQPRRQRGVGRPPRRRGAARSPAYAAGARGRRRRRARRRGARRCARPGRSGPGRAPRSPGCRRTSARAVRSPSRSWWAVCATSRSGSLIRRPSWRAISQPSAEQHQPEADDRPPRPRSPRAAGRPRSRSARTTAVPLLAGRPGAAPRRRPPRSTRSASPVERPAYVGVLAQVVGGAEAAAARREHRDLRDDAAG